MNTFPDLPDFLRARHGETLEERGWKGRKLTKQGSGFRTIDAAEERHRNRLRKEIEREQERKQQERFKVLRERYDD